MSWVLDPLLLPSSFLTPAFNNFQEIYEIQTSNFKHPNFPPKQTLKKFTKKINFQNQTLTRVNKVTFDKKNKLEAGDHTERSEVCLTSFTCESISVRELLGGGAASTLDNVSQGEIYRCLVSQSTHLLQYT